MEAKNSQKTSKKKGQTSRKKSSVKSISNQKVIPEEDQTSDAIMDEVYLIITLIISFLLILSYINLCGPVGKILNSIVFGMIGFLGYLFPFALFFGVAFGLSNRGNRVAARRLFSGIGSFFILTSLIQMITGFDKSIGIIGYFQQCGEKRTGGGLIGSLLLKILCPSVGTVATVIILLALLMICIILFTGKSFVASLREIGTKSTQWFSKDQVDREEEDDFIEEETLEEEELQEKELDEGSRHRQAKIITLKQKQQETSKNTDMKEVVYEEQVPKTEPEEKGHANKIERIDRIRNNKVEMEEIIPSEPFDFSISGDYQRSNELKKEISDIYEEELKRKFGQGEEDKKGADEMEMAETEKMQENIVSSDRESSSKEEKSCLKIENVKSLDNKEDLSSVQKQDEERSLSFVKNQPKKEEPASTETQVTEIVWESEKRPYVFPPISLLSEPEDNQKKMTEQELKETAAKLQSTLESFGVRVTVNNISCGPAVTRYELQPEQGVKVSKITNLSDDIKLNLAASDIRIEAPISGKAAVGIEVPNKETSSVPLRELLDHKEFKEHKSNIAFAVGKDISGQVVVTDIGKMPHLLIAGATGSGKSVCLNTLIMSILYKAEPSQVKLIMIDPKVVELSIYNGIPHLLIPVVTDPKKASAALNWAVAEMTDRYKKFADLGVRDLRGYNEKVSQAESFEEPKYQKLPQIVIIVDELADLMMVASNEVETAICRLAQMARAAGLHLIIATQRPSVNVITGVIKANIPSRIAFAVSSSVDSRTIIDSSGAESLLGRGDMLFFPSGIPKPIRVQGAFVSDKEVSAVVDFLKEQNEQIEYSDTLREHILGMDSSESGSVGSGDHRDDYFIEAGKLIIEKEKASIGMLQRVYKIGFNRAARIMDQLAEAGVVGPEEGTKPRKILMTMEEFEQYIEEVF